MVTWRGLCAAPGGWAGVPGVCAGGVPGVRQDRGGPAQSVGHGQLQFKKRKRSCPTWNCCCSLFFKDIGDNKSSKMNLCLVLYCQTNTHTKKKSVLSGFFDGSSLSQVQISTFFSQYLWTVWQLPHIFIWGGGGISCCKSLIKKERDDFYFINIKCKVGPKCQVGPTFGPKFQVRPKC